MQSETIRRTADGVYLGQIIRLRMESGYTHPAIVDYVHPSGKWVMLKVILSNGNTYRECFQTFELMNRGAIEPRIVI